MWKFAEEASPQFLKFSDETLEKQSVRRPERPSAAKKPQHRQRDKHQSTLPLIPGFPWKWFFFYISLLFSGVNFKAGCERRVGRWTQRDPSALPSQPASWKLKLNQERNHLFPRLCSHFHYHLRSLGAYWAQWRLFYPSTQHRGEQVTSQDITLRSSSVLLSSDHIDTHRDRWTHILSISVTHI